MIDHIGVSVKDMEKSKAFYEAALKPINYSKIMDFGVACGFGENGKTDFWLASEEKIDKIHVAFRCESRAMVDAFYKAALAAGGTDNGAPGLRENYHPNYYGAFIHDPDGNNIEAVCHLPE